MMFLDCPAYLDHEGARRCGLPAEVRCQYAMRSTDGPLECAMIRCPAGHHFNGPIESLTWEDKDRHDKGTAAAGSRPGRGRSRGSHDRNHGREGSAPQDLPGEPEPASRPNTTPAYYLGHPARLWITVMRPRSTRTTSHYPNHDLTGGKRAPFRPSSPSPASEPKQSTRPSQIVASNMGAVGY